MSLNSEPAAHTGGPCFLNRLSSSSPWQIESSSDEWHMHATLISYSVGCLISWPTQLNEGNSRDSLLRQLFKIIW